MSGSVYPGITSPAFTTFDVTTDDAALDLSTTIGATLEIIFGDETEAQWTCTFADIPGVASASGQRLTRVHQDADVPAGSEGFLSVRAALELSGGDTVLSEWRTLIVKRAGT